MDALKVKNVGIDLFKRMYKPAENILISPLSIMMAMGMVANLAVGETLDEFEQLLCDNGLGELNTYFAYMQSKLDKEGLEQFLIANALYFHKDLVGTDENAVKILQDSYRAGLKLVDFANPGVLSLINQWVSENTQGKITELLKELDENTTSVLLNAIYFKGDWEDGYKVSRTQKQPFINLDGSQVETDFMFKREHMRYIDTVDCLGFIDNYKSKKYQFFALMPKGDFNGFVESFSFDALRDLLSGGRRLEGEIDLSLPKFKVETPTFSVGDELYEMGLCKAFELGANLTLLGSMPDKQPIFIGDVLHKATFEVDEVGTEASAATAVVMMRGMSLNVTPKVTIDRPFIYGIIDRADFPMFVGSIVKL